MASFALGKVWQPRTLTDRRSDITTVKSKPSPAGLTSPDVVTPKPGTIDFVMECGEEVRRVRFRLPDSPGPQWLSPTILRAGRLLSLPSDWNRQGALPIDPTVIQTALDTLSSFMSPNSSLPQWTPTDRSGVQLDWHENDIDLEIAFEPGEPGGYVVFGDRRNPNEEWDGPVEEHIVDLRTLLRERLIL